MNKAHRGQERQHHDRDIEDAFAGRVFAEWMHESFQVRSGDRLRRARWQASAITSPLMDARSWTLQVDRSALLQPTWRRRSPSACHIPSPPPGLKLPEREDAG